MTLARTLSAADIQNLFTRSTVGAERLFDDFFSGRAEANYPPYNIVALSENDYRITLAVAGFSREELEITVDNGRLTLKGTKEPAVAPEEGEKFPLVLHRGIAERNFERQFKLMEYVAVSGVKLQDGLLIVDLKRELPDALKPRTIQID